MCPGGMRIFCSNNFGQGGGRNICKKSTLLLLLHWGPSQFLPVHEGGGHLY